jgi:hypothetical protein
VVTSAALIMVNAAGDASSRELGRCVRRTFGGGQRAYPMAQGSGPMEAAGDTG